MVLRKRKVEIGNSGFLSEVRTQSRIGHDSASALEMAGGPIEFPSVTLPVLQAAADGLVHDDLSSLRRLQRGKLKTVPTQ